MGGSPGGGAAPASALGPTSADKGEEPTVGGMTAAEIGQMADNMLAENPNMSEQDVAEAVVASLGIDPDAISGGPEGTGGSASMAVDKYGEARGGSGQTATGSTQNKAQEQAVADFRAKQEADKARTLELLEMETPTADSVSRAWAEGLSSGALTPEAYSEAIGNAFSYFPEKKIKVLQDIGSQLATGAINPDMFQTFFTNQMKFAEGLGYDSTAGLESDFMNSPIAPPSIAPVVETPAPPPAPPPVTPESPPASEFGPTEADQPLPPVAEIPAPEPEPPVIPEVPGPEPEPPIVPETPPVVEPEPPVVEPPIIEPEPPVVEPEPPVVEPPIIEPGPPIVEPEPPILPEEDIGGPGGGLGDDEDIGGPGVGLGEDDEDIPGGPVEPEEEEEGPGGPPVGGDQRGTLLPGYADTDIWRKSLLGRKVKPLWWR